MGVLFIPGIKESLDSWFVWAVGLLSFAVIALIIRALWRRRTVEEQEEARTLSPIYIHSEEERAQFRAMCGVTERPSRPMKVVTPQDDDRKQASDFAQAIGIQVRSALAWASALARAPCVFAFCVHV